MSADRGVLFLVLLRRGEKKGKGGGRRFTSTVTHFLLATVAERSYHQLSAVVKFQSQRKQSGSSVHTSG